ncbi:MAG: RNA polymerase sigma-70 factor [Muribaculum sp.]|nr:RNA polymerase sigma-70 factor [Muribaculum sp.]
MEQIDEKILSQIHDGDTGALGVLYMEYAPKVRDFAFRFVQNREEADDITHDVFFKIWELRKSLSGISSIKAYLFRMTKNAILNNFRQKQIQDKYCDDIRNNISEESDDTDSAVTTADLLEMIELAIDRMPEQRRKVFCMSRYENMTYEQIAQKLDISPKTVQYHISAALAELRKVVHVISFFI